MLLKQKYASFELRQVPLVRSSQRRYFSNRIQVFPNTPNFLNSHVDLLNPGSPDYGPALVYGYGEGRLEGDSSSSSSDERTCPRQTYSRGPFTSSDGAAGSSQVI